MDSSHHALLSHICLENLHSLAARCKGIVAAVAATTDGYLLASIGNEVAAVKIAVMSGSMQALGQSIMQEGRAGECSSVVVESDRDKLVIVAVPRLEQDIIVTGLAGPESTVGFLRSCCKQCAEDISRGSQALLVASDGV